MTDTSEDVILVEKALSGCQSAWVEIVKTHQANLFRYVFREIPEIGFTKDDIFQYFWLCMFKTRLAKYTGRSPLNYFLRAELRARIGDLIRASRTNRENVINYDESIKRLSTKSAGSDGESGEVAIDPFHLETPCLVLEARQSFESGSYAA